MTRFLKVGLLALCLWTGMGSVTAVFSQAPAPPSDRYERAVVETIGSGERKDGDQVQQVNVYRIRFLGGPLNNQTQEVFDEVTSNPYALKPAVGDKLVLLVQRQFLIKVHRLAQC